MRSMTRFPLTRSAALACLTGGLVPAAAFAGPAITGWGIETGDTSERIELRWSERGSVDMNHFAKARQVVAVLPEASIGPETQTRLDVSGSRLIERARLQEVTLPDGSDGVQITLQLSYWTTVSNTAEDGTLAFTLTVPEQFRQSEGETVVLASQGDGLVFTDERIAERDRELFGAEGAPRTGAGQQEDPEAGPLAEFYVPETIAPEARPDYTPPDERTLEVEARLDEPVSRVDFQGTPLENVLRAVAEEAELNILIRPQDVAGRTVTLRLRNVTLRQMLDGILRMNELGYTIEDGGIVRILPRSQVTTTVKETTTETILINWVAAQDVAESVRPFLDREDGMVQVSRANNMLIVRDVPENIRHIQDLIRRIDVPEKQVLIELRLVNMSESARRAFGTRTGIESQATDPRFIRDPDANFFDLGEFTNATRNLTGTTTLTDTVTRTTTSGATTTGGTGVLPSTTTTSGFTNTGTNTLTGTLTDSTTSSVGMVPSSRATAGLLAPGAEALQYSQLATWNVFGTRYDIDFALNAEEARGEAVTLANPTVLSLNNQEARVEIKRQIPFTSAISAAEGSVATVEFIDVGTEVAILPRITNNGYVQMNIRPEQIIDTGDRPGGVPVTDERRVQASVIVKDEETIALGGLREFSATSSETGVPYLLRLPVLSWLFKNQENTQDKTELYLFVTPHIVKDPTPSSYQMALYDKIDYNWDLPDYYFDEVFARQAPGEEDDPRLRR